MTSSPVKDPLDLFAHEGSPLKKRRISLAVDKSPLTRYPMVSSPQPPSSPSLTLPNRINLRSSVNPIDQHREEEEESREGSESPVPTSDKEEEEALRFKQAGFRKGYWDAVVGLPRELASSPPQTVQEDQEKKELSFTRKNRRRLSRASSPLVAFHHPTFSSFPSNPLTPCRTHQHDPNQPQPSLSAGPKRQSPFPAVTKPLVALKERDRNLLDPIPFPSHSGTIEVDPIRQDQEGAQHTRSLGTSSRSAEAENLDEQLDGPLGTSISVDLPSETHQMSFSNPNPEILGPNLGVIADRLGDAVTYQSSLDTQTSWDSLDLPALGEEYEDFEGEEDDEEETLLNDIYHEVESNERPTFSNLPQSILSFSQQTHQQSSSPRIGSPPIPPPIPQDTPLEGPPLFSNQQGSLISLMDQINGIKTGTTLPNSETNDPTEDQPPAHYSPSTPPNPARRSSSLSPPPIIQTHASSSHLPPPPSPTVAQLNAIPDVAVAQKRTLRQRTSLQLQPYTRERLAYKQRLAMRGFKDALVPREDEMELSRREKTGAKDKGKTRETDGEDPLGGWLEEEGDEVLVMLEGGEESWSPGPEGNGTDRMGEGIEGQVGEGSDGGRKDKGKGRAKDVGSTQAKRSYTRKKAKDSVPISLDPLTITPGRNPNLRQVRLSGLPAHPEGNNQDFDFTAFGIDQPPPNDGQDPSPSLAAPAKKPHRSAQVLSDSGSDSESTSSSSSVTSKVVLAKKKQKILNRMMPAVLAKRHLQDLAYDKEERRALRLAERQAARVPEGPLRAGQSIVRRAPGAGPKRAFVIEGDSESSAEEEQAPIVVEQGRHRRLDVLLNRDVVDPKMVEAMYGAGDELLPETDDEEDEVVFVTDSEEGFAQNDIRRWIGMPNQRAESVVDQQLSRTAARPKSQFAGRNRNLTSRSRPSKHQTTAGRIGSSRPATTFKKVAVSRSKPHRPARPAQIVLDDDSIFGDFQPPPRPARRAGEHILPRKNRLGGGRSAAPAGGARAPPNPQRPNPPIVNRHSSPGLAGQPNSPAPPTPHRMVARHSSGSPAGFRQPSVDRGMIPSMSEGVPWDSYAGFSLDFDMHPLRTGLSFSPTSFLVQNHLTELLALASVLDQPPPPPIPCSVFDLELAADMSLSSFSEAFGVIINRLYEAVDPDREINGDDGDDELRTQLQTTCEQALRFTCLFVTSRRSDEEFVDTFYPAVMDGMETLLEQLEPITTPTSLKHLKAQLFFRLHWFMIELSTRFAFSSPLVLDQVRESQQGLCSILVRRLLEYGFSRTIKSVKIASISFSTELGDHESVVQDYTAELWVALIHLLSTMDPISTPEPFFWSAVSAGLQATGIMIHGLLAAEKIWYITQGICCISQFSQAGVAQFSPFASPYWPLISDALSSVKLEGDPAHDADAATSTLKKRDKYVWTVLGRCYLLGSRWEWKLNAKDPILGQLGQKIFKTRKFLNLLSDPIVSDFPLFIRESNRSLTSEVDSSVDSAFHVFIKILALTVRDTRKSASEGSVSKKQGEREISRLLAISAPMGKVSFTRASPPTMRELSTLINRYSYSIISVLLDPAEATSIHSLRQMRNYLAFETADFKSRKICIRAMMYMSVLHRHLRLELQGVAEWLGDMTLVLLQELSPTSRPPGNTLQEGFMAPKHELIFCLSLILGSIRHIISSPNKTGDGSEDDRIPYPDPVLLHKAWTEGILSSSLALEPMTGLEVLRCVQAFLNARRAALSFTNKVTLADPVGDSQDEFGAEFAAIDMNDPSLLLLLDGRSEGVPPEASANAGSHDVAKDKVFALAVNNTVSPAIYKLLSNMVLSDQAWVHLVGDMGTTISREEDLKARESYMAQLVDCWSGCASVLVQHRMKDWSSYVELGTESWKRFSESSTKRQIGLRFMWNLAQMDPLSYEPLKEHFFSIWFQAIVAPSSTYTVEPHYTALLFGMDNLDDRIFFQLPVERNEDGVFEFNDVSFEAQRLDILNRVFSNLDVELSRNASGNITLLQRKTYLMSCVRDMLVSMTQHVRKMQGTPAGNNYITFCWDVISRLKDKAGSVINERTMRELVFFESLSILS